MKLFKFLAAAAILVGTAAIAHAQVATQVTQSGTHLDASSFFIGQANGATSCNTVSQTAANDTITIPAVGGQSIYLTGIYVQNSTDATGVTQVPTISLTGIPNGGSPVFLSAASALTTVQGIAPMYSWLFPTGLKALPGTAVTIVPSATQSAHNILCMQAAGFYAP